MNYSFHAPIQRMSNKGKRLQLEQWIAKRILTSINAKNRICRKYCRTKNQNTKKELYNSCKFYHNTLKN